MMSEKSSMPSDVRIFVVDDDPSVRKSLTRLLRSAEYELETFGSADEFLQHEHYDGPSCLILDVQMPGLTGMELQQALISSGHTMPIIFITGHGNIPMSVKAMKHGAVDFLPKPFSSKDLLAAVEKAIEKDIAQRKDRQEVEEIQSRINTLTAREREVFLLVVTGMLNKQIASELGTSEKTIKVHRARVMEKMRAGSLAELVQLSERIQVRKN